MSLFKPTIIQGLCPLVKVLCRAVLVVLLSFCLSSLAVAGVYGDAELSYSSFVAKEDGRKVLDMKAFTQNYTLFYDKSGPIVDRRLGWYNLGLGYQWSAVDASIDSDDAEFNDNNKYSYGKVLYNGEVSIEPGGLPFRLHAYSYDNSKTTFISREPRNSIIDRSIVYDLSNGEHNLTGLSLVAGIQNGSYLGKYRSYLSMFPRIFIDYKEVRNRKSTGITRYDNRLRDLAFVSLNKKDNWFHYRASSYKDFKNKKNNYSDERFLLGSVDQNLKRQWINLTNWIELSADGSFTREKSEDYVKFYADPEAYNLNMFAIANYGKTRVSSLNSYTRERHNDGFETKFDAPQFASGWLDPNRSWAISLQLNSQDQTLSDELINNNSTTNEHTRYLSGRLNIGHQQPVKILLSLESEMFESDQSDAYGVRARFERSNKHIQKKQTFLLGYTATFIHNETRLDQDSSDTFEQALYGSVKWDITPRNTLTASQELTYSTGELSSRGTSYITLKGVPRTYSSTYESSSKDYYGLQTSLDLETRLQASLTNRFALFNVSVVGGYENFNHTTLEQSLIFRQRNIRYRMENSLDFGDDLETPSLTFSTDRNYTGLRGLETPNREDINYVLRHESAVEYYPLRNFKSNARFSLTLFADDDDNTYKSEFFQKSEYTFYSKIGSTRKLLSVYQRAEYEKYSRGDSSSSYLSLLAGVSFFPYRFLEFGSDIRYEYFDPAGFQALTVTTAASMSFKKLVCEVLYSYGLGKLDEGQFDERTEHLFEANVKRIF